MRSHRYLGCRWVVRESSQSTSGIRRRAREGLRSHLFLALCWPEGTTSQAAWCPSVVHGTGSLLPLLSGDRRSGSGEGIGALARQPQGLSTALSQQATFYGQGRSASLVLSGLAADNIPTSRCKVSARLSESSASLVPAVGATGVGPCKPRLRYLRSGEGLLEARFRRRRIAKAFREPLYCCRHAEKALRERRFLCPSL